MASDPPSPTMTASSISQPSGRSMAGSRQVTGMDDPASIGKRSRRDASTMALAFSKL